MRQKSIIESVRSNYHHGDLRQALLMNARQLIVEDGIESLSLRKLAHQIGVSRTAAYHHFDSKDDLLCAIAAEGFDSRYREMVRQNSGEQKNQRQVMRRFVCDYVSFAAKNPEVYELMFGRYIWKRGKCTSELKQAAYQTFQYQLQMVKKWQDSGLIRGDDHLRTSQVVWGTLHGIAQLFIDGIYADVTRLEAITLTAVDMLMSSQSLD